MHYYSDYSVVVEWSEHDQSKYDGFTAVLAKDNGVGEKMDFPN